MTVETGSRHPIEELADEFAERYRRGEGPSIEDFASRYPELAGDIRELFPALCWIEDSAAQKASASDRSDTPVGIGETHTTSSGDSHEIDVPTKIGRFEITGLIGIGGFGIVFEALDPELHRKVAVKVPRGESLLSPELRSRFVREAEAAAALDHPGIVPIYESGAAGPLHYIASAYVEGPTLAEWLHKRGGRLAPRDAAELVRALAEAVQHAHSRGVLHRDLKPANVLMSDVPRITDFGLARYLGEDSGQTRLNAIVGTPSYMAPEQASGRNGDVGTAADIYALGAMLYELLTGRPPFEGESTMATLQAVVAEDPEPPARLNANVTADLDAVCLKCLEKQPEERYASAAALAEDLQRYLHGDPVTARRPTRRELLRRWCARNRATAALLSIVTLLTVLIAVGSTIAAVLLGESRQDVLDHLAREIEAKDAATRSEDLAIRALYEARVAQAHAQRNSGQIGQRSGSLAALSAAAQSVERLKFGDAERLTLRNEAMAAMALPDLVPEQDWDIDWRPGLQVATDANVEHYAWNSDAETILVQRFSDNAVVHRLTAPGGAPGRNSSVGAIRFCPDGRWLAAQYWSGAAGFVHVWELTGGESGDPSTTPGRQPVYTADAMHGDLQPVDFSVDGEMLAVSRRSGAVDLIATRTFDTLATLAHAPPAEIVRFNSTSTRLAVSRTGRIDIVDLVSKETLREITPPDMIYDLDWCPGTDLLAGTCGDQSAHVWNTATGAVETTLRGHAARVRRVSFHPDGRHLATWGDDTTTRIWNVHSGRQVLLAEAELTNFSTDGLRLGAGTQRFRFLGGDAIRVASFHQAIDGRMSTVDLLSADSTGRVLLVSNAFECVLVDLLTGGVLDAGRVGYGWVRFNAAGTGVVGVSRRAGLCRLPIQYEPASGEVAFHIGPPERLSAAPVGFLATSDHSGLVACAEWRTGSQVILFNADRSASKTVDHPRTRFLDVSGDGRLLATGTWGGRDVRVWDTINGRLVKTLPAGNARVRFSPDATRLVVDEGRRHIVWNVEDWQPLATAESKSHSTDPGPIAYSGDGRLLAVLETRRVVLLLDGASCEELARFTLPEHCFIQALCLTPDGSRLVAGTFRPGLVFIWDLAHIRGELSAMGLDWAAKPYPLATGGTSDPIRVHLDLGELGAASGAGG